MSNAATAALNMRSTRASLEWTGAAMVVIRVLLMCWATIQCDLSVGDSGMAELTECGKSTIGSAEIRHYLTGSGTMMLRRKEKSTWRAGLTSSAKHRRLPKAAAT